MRFIDLTPSLSGQWDEIVEHSDDAWFFHGYDWLSLSQRSWSVQQKSFLVEYESKLVAIVPLELKKPSRSLKSTYMGFGGPALINGLQEGVRKKILKGIHEHIQTIALKHRSPFIEVLLSPLSAASFRNKWHVNPLVYFGYEDTSTHTWMVDLSATEEQIVEHYADDARRSIKHALALGYQVSAVSTNEEMDQVYQIHCETRRRTKAEIHPKVFFDGVFNDLCSKNRVGFWLAKDALGQAVAFETTALFKQGALYWMGGCQTQHLESGINYLLQHHAMMWAKSQGALWFENGEAFPNVREGKLHGLTVFKGKFGGELHRLYKGKILLRYRQIPFLQKLMSRLSWKEHANP